MPYNPNIHHRRSIRLKGYDYSHAGMYFVTICCQNKICRFGKIENREMILNDFGEIVRDEWQYLTVKYPHIALHEYVIMPNHFHAIVEITNAPVGAGFARPNNPRPDNPPPDIPATPNIISDFSNDDVNENIYGRANGINQLGGGIQGRANPAPTVTVGNIIGYFKYQTTKKIDLSVKLWQRNYWEHIIRNEKSYQRITNYIINNPTNWENDKFYTA